MHILSCLRNHMYAFFVMFFSNEDGLTVILKNIINMNSILREDLEVSAPQHNLMVRFFPFSGLRRDLPVILFHYLVVTTFLIFR